MRAKQATGSGKMIWMLQKRQAPVTAAPIRIMSRKPYHGLEAGHELPVWRNQWSAAYLFPELPAKPLAADELTLDTDARHANTCVYTYSSLEHNPPRTLTTFLRRLSKFEPHRTQEDGEDEVCGGEQSVHGSDAGRRHRAQGAGGEAVLVRGEAARRAGARSAVAVVGRQRRRGVAEDGHVPQLLGAKLGSCSRGVAGAAAACTCFDRQLLAA